jgi:Fe-S cluster biogenesis protein NfuA
VDAETVHAIRSGPPDDGTAVVPLRAWLEARDGDPAVASVYAIYGADDVMRYVGYAKDASRAVRSHLERQGDDTASKVRVAAFANKATATRANLRAEQDRWIGEWVVSRGGAETEIPVGNQAAGAARWTLTPAESWENEEKPAAAEAKANEAGTPSVGADGEVISPYAAEAAGADAEEDEVRPYLIADGGNVAVVGIEDGVVAVRMSGACGSCSSSTATLKGGIEKTLRRVFGGENVKEVVNLDSDEPGSALTLSKEAVEAHLEKLAGAIHNYGGSVKLLEVIESERALVLEFSGPVALAQSIASSIKGKFPLVAECKIKQV